MRERIFAVAAILVLLFVLVRGIILPWLLPEPKTAQYLHTLVVLAGCDADINATEPLDVMAPKLAACVAEQRRRLIEFEAMMEQNVGSPVQVPTFAPQPKLCPCDDREYWRNLTRDGVFPRTEHDHGLLRGAASPILEHEENRSQSVNPEHGEPR